MIPIKDKYKSKEVSTLKLNFCCSFYYLKKFVLYEMKYVF